MLGNLLDDGWSHDGIGSQLRNDEASVEGEQSGGGEVDLVVKHVEPFGALVFRRSAEKKEHVDTVAEHGWDDGREGGDHLMSNHEKRGGSAELVELTIVDTHSGERAHQSRRKSLHSMSFSLENDDPHQFLAVMRKNGDEWTEDIGGSVK